jgi:NCAIR mutase (PurE)-related protein
MTPPKSESTVDHLIEEFKKGTFSSLELGQRILRASIASSGAMTIDLEREKRCGFPEVIYGAGKSNDAIRVGIEQLLAQHDEVLVTRVVPEQVRALSEWFPFHRWNHMGRTLRVGRDSTPAAPDEIKHPIASGRVAVVSAGTTDEPIALEAVETLAWMKIQSCLIQDVGVAGPYRLLARVPELQQMSAVVCVAGMEGALPSVIGGHVGCPVIAVPTSVGYGANFAGLSALLTMLNSCASNIAVVNIDSGFKGAYMAGLIVSRAFSRT